jgi:hypothetical protein
MTIIAPLPRPIGVMGPNTKNGLQRRLHQFRRAIFPLNTPSATHGADQAWRPL